MEFVAARALKSSFLSEFAMKSTQYDDLMMDVNGINGPNYDDFPVDVFLDLSGDDLDDDGQIVDEPETAKSSSLSVSSLDNTHNQSQHDHGRFALGRSLRFPIGNPSSSSPPIGNPNAPGCCETTADWKPFSALAVGGCGSGESPSPRTSTTALTIDDGGEETGRCLVDRNRVEASISEMGIRWFWIWVMTHIEQRQLQRQRVVAMSSFWLESGLLLVEDACNG